MSYSFRLIRNLLICAAAICAAATAGLAASGPWDRNDHAAVRLVSASDGTGNRETLTFGLEYALKPGWKVYWRTPGDAGFPPIPDWSKSRNVADVDMRWPRPERFEIFDLESLGYKDSVVFPLTVRTEAPGAPVTLSAKIPYLLCDEICIPYEANVSLDLPGGDAIAAPEAHLISRFEGAVPVDAAMAGIDFTKGGFDLAEDKITLQITARSDQGFQSPDLIIEGPEGSYFHKPAVSVKSGAQEAVFQVTGGGASREDMQARPITITLWDGVNAVEGKLQLSQGIADPMSAAPARQGRSSAGVSIWTMIAYALLGGLILNLMPCVLPVLSLKLLSVVSHGGGDKGPVRLGFVASAAGIMTAFLILAGILAAMKQFGVAVGWGIQFQNPVFITVMVLVVTLFAANLLGLFEVRLPGQVSDYAATAGNQQKGLAGHFTTGMFATLLATPCSAPFLGPAVGFALGQDTQEIFIIFASLAVGLAAPYLLVALFPGMVTVLPRPGAWMNKLKAVLSLALLGTAAWLLTVLDSISGRELAIIVTAFAALILLVLLIRRKLPAARLARMAPAAALLLMASAVTATVIREPVQQPANGSLVESADWVAFDEAAIPAYLAQGKTVFVDVTADWCITCLYNKKNVLDAEPVFSMLNSPDVIRMRADWTRPDPAISDYLNRHGRYGIPFNIIYGPDRPEGVALSEFLVSSDVMDALGEAGLKRVAKQN